MAADHLRHLGDGPLRQAAGGLVGQRLRAEAELEDDPVGELLLQRRQEHLVDVGRVYVALGRPGLASLTQSAFAISASLTGLKSMSVEMCVAIEIIDVDRNVAHIPLDGLVNVVQERMTRSVGGRLPAPIGVGLSGVLPQHRSSS